MKTKTFKEITPVFYGENLAKVLHFKKNNQRELCFAAHYHERMELLRIRQGSMQLEIDGHALTANAGDLVIITPNQSHAGICCAPALLYDVIMFDLANLNNNSFAYHRYIEPILQQKIRFTIQSSHPAVLSAVDDLIAAYTARESIHPLHTVGMIYSLLGAFYQHGNPFACTPEARTGFNAITAYIDEHFSEPLSTNTLSTVFGYNETYFSRMFKKTTGETVMQYITTLRLQRAQQLLHNTDDSIRSIALKCGFNDTFYFSTRFKQHTGQSPRDFRSQCRKDKT